MFSYLKSSQFHVLVKNLWLRKPLKLCSMKLLINSSIMLFLVFLQAKAAEYHFQPAHLFIGVNLTPSNVLTLCRDLICWFCKYGFLAEDICQGYLIYWWQCKQYCLYLKWLTRLQINVTKRKGGRDNKNSKIF